MKENSGMQLYLDRSVYREDISVAYEAAEGLVQHSLDKGLMPRTGVVYVGNQILDVMGTGEYEGPQDPVKSEDLEAILKGLLNCATGTSVFEENSVVYRNLLGAKLMDRLMPEPGEVAGEFWRHCKELPEKATGWCYGFSQDSDYVRRYRTARDMEWTTNTRYGTLDVTVNLSKPRRDPKAITATRLTKQGGYPKCQLCIENMGYVGRINHPAQNNHRIIPITTNNSRRGFQYSPYVYYSEHHVVSNRQHVPMRIDRTALRRLFDSTKQPPHYFLGPNANLPIVGGSILGHDHFQGEHYTSTIAKAPIEKRSSIKGYGDVKAGIAFWLMSALRFRTADPDRLVELGDVILKAWRGYIDEDAFILAETDEEPHNTIAPIARKVGDTSELDLVLRNDVTTKEFSLDVYHPHQELHRIKKGNIGLIEVMELTVLSSRLKTELAVLGKYVAGGEDIQEDEVLLKHADQAGRSMPGYQERGILVTRDSVWFILQGKMEKVFAQVLEDAGVYKRDERGWGASTGLLHSVRFEEV